MADTPDASTRETVLMALVAKGDHGAFTALYDEHSTVVYSVSLRILADPEEARDITQAVFLVLYQKPASWNPQYGRLAAWLAVMARNRSLSRIRSLRVRHRFAQHLHGEAAADVGETPPVMDTGETAILKQALDELPEPQRRAVEMAFFGSLTHEQIAADLSEPLGTVKARIRRGLLRLRGKCVQLGIGRPGFEMEPA